MCRNIRPLFNYEPPATDEEIRDAALQFVRKVSGSRTPSRANQIPFDSAVEEIAVSVRVLLDSLVTSAPPRNREVERDRARERNRRRFG